MSAFCRRWSKASYALNNNVHQLSKYEGIDMTGATDHWYAVETLPNKESAACGHLENFGIGSYVPTCLRSVTKNRYTKRKELKEFPIVSCIVFVNCAEPMTPRLASALTAPVSADHRITALDMPEGRDAHQWARMAASMRNCVQSPITGVYGADGIPSEIPWRQIEAMSEANEDRDKILRARHRGEIPLIAPGTRVRMKEGPLTGYAGLVVDGLHNRLNILIHMLGQETKVEADIDQIEELC